MPTKGRRSGGSSVASPKLAIFTPVGWYQHWNSTDYLAHIFKEAGRLGIDDFRHDSTRTTISDLLRWFSCRENDGFEQLYNWWQIDRESMASRLKVDSEAKPRIEITAGISIRDNLSVVWHPGGWDQSTLSWSGHEANPLDLIPRRTWPKPPDFMCFTGDESQYASQRASNELMYIRQVGNLRPEPRDEYGYYAQYNHDVVDAVLICAVRAAYEGLIKQLQRNFEVTAITSFDFELREDQGRDGPVRRVTSWQIERTQTLLQRKMEADAIARFNAASEDLLRAEADLEITAEAVGDAIKRATAEWKGDKPPAMTTLEKHAARLLRAEGHPLTEREVRRMLRIMVECKHHLLPAHLWPT